MPGFYQQMGMYSWPLFLIAIAIGIEKGRADAPAGIANAGRGGDVGERDARDLDLRQVAESHAHPVFADTLGIRRGHIEIVDAMVDGLLHPCSGFLGRGFIHHNASETDHG